MEAHHYTLEPYRGKTSRYPCPSCQQPRAFVRYINTHTGEYVSPDVGRCNRESKCRYHRTPKQHFGEYPSRINGHIHYLSPAAAPKKPASIISIEIFKGSFHAYDCNSFITYLTNLFGEEVTSQLISRYFIGTSSHWQGATVFWQIDALGNVRAGKIMLYNSNTGRRVKNPHSYVTWVHSALLLQDYNLSQCFFGEHLLKKEPHKPVAIVESEKTAIIASVFLPGFVWLATGSKDGLNREKCRVLQGRKVILFPDLDAHDKWTTKANELADLATFAVSDLLETKASQVEREQGLDLADYLVSCARLHKTKQVPVSKPLSVSTLKQEFYKYTYEELQKLLGAEEAKLKVVHYLELSNLYKGCKSFVVHTCPLLSSFSNSIMGKKAA